MTTEDAIRELEIRDARINRLTDALDGLERLVSRIGGYMTMAQQEALADARAALAGEGVHRKPKETAWRDRG